MFFDPLAFSIFVTLEIGTTMQTNGAFPVASPHAVQGRIGEIGEALVNLLQVLRASLLGKYLDGGCYRSHDIWVSSEVDLLTFELYTARQAASTSRQLVSLRGPALLP